MKSNRTVVGVDTAKRVFQLHWVDVETGEIVVMKLTRRKFLEHFANRRSCVVAMEACGVVMFGTWRAIGGIWRG